MDINSVNGVYYDIAGAQTDAANLEKMKADYKKLNKGSEEKQLMDACKDFEAYFIEQMYKAMWKTVPEGEYSSNSSRSSMEYYRDNFIKEISSQTAENGDLGLAQMLFDNMKVHLNALSIEEVQARLEEKKAAESAAAAASSGAGAAAFSEPVSAAGSDGVSISMGVSEL